MAIAGIITGIVCSLIGLASIAALSAPMLIRQRQKADTIAIISNLKIFHIQALEYADDHNDAFPDKVAATAFLSDLKIRRTNKGEWLYFPQASTSIAGEVLLISPATPETVVLHVDGSVKILKDKEMVRKLIDTSRTPPVEIPATRR